METVFHVSSLAVCRGCFDDKVLFRRYTTLFQSDCWLRIEYAGNCLEEKLPSEVPLSRYTMHTYYAPRLFDACQKGQLPMDKSVLLPHSAVSGFSTLPLRIHTSVQLCVFSSYTFPRCRTWRQQQRPRQSINLMFHH